MSMMKPARKKPAIPLSNVPTVKELCEKLGFQHASSRQTSDFLDITHAFRKQYRTSSGTPGAELTDWNQGVVQHELFIMAIRFLDEAGNGVRYWSETRSWSEDGDLSYPEEKLHIAEILKQLFFKQNKYADNNQRYAERKNNESQDHSLERPTPVPRSPSTATYRSLQAMPRASVETMKNSTNVKPMGPVISLLEDDMSVPFSAMENAVSSAPESQKSDIFDVPSSENESREVRQTSMITNTLTACIPKKPSGSRIMKAGNKKNAKNKPSPKNKKGPANKPSKAASKRPIESPSRLSKRRRTTASDSVLLFGKRAEDALDQFDREQMVEREQHEEENNEGNERGTGEDDQGDHRQKRPRPLPVPRSEASGLPDDTRSINASTHQIDIDTQGEVGKARTGFIAPLAPMIASSSRNNIFCVPTSLPTPPTQSPPASQRESEARKQPPKVRGLFWIIASTQPNKKSRRQWKNGQLKGKRLSALIDEISNFIGIGPIEELNLKLETFLNDTHVTVHRDDEKFWEETQRDFQKQIKEAFTKDCERGGQYKIWIEPVCTENQEMGGNDDADSEDFEW